MPPPATDPRWRARPALSRRFCVTLTRLAQCVADASFLAGVAGPHARFTSLDASHGHVALGTAAGRRGAAADSALPACVLTPNTHTSAYVFARARRADSEGTPRLAAIVTPPVSPPPPQQQQPQREGRDASLPPRALVLLRFHPHAPLLAAATAGGDVLVLDTGLTVRAEMCAPLDSATS